MISKKTQKQIKHRRMLEAIADKHYSEFTDHELVVIINRCIGILKERLIRDEFINFNVTTKELSVLKTYRKRILEPVTETYITEEGRHRVLDVVHSFFKVITKGFGEAKSLLYIYKVNKKLDYDRKNSSNRN